MELFGWYNKNEGGGGSHILMQDIVASSAHHPPHRSVSHRSSEGKDASYIIIILQNANGETEKRAGQDKRVWNCSPYLLLDSGPGSVLHKGDCCAAESCETTVFEIPSLFTQTAPLLCLCSSDHHRLFLQLCCAKNPSCHVLIAIP